MRILVVEDNEALARGLTKVLKGSGYAVDRVGDGVSANAVTATQRYDLVVLDLTLPEMDGLDVLRSMRGRHDDTPVLVLTARGALDERVRGLNLGADDYLAKPFEVNELEARIRVLLRRRAGLGSSIAEYGPLALDLNTRLLSCFGKTVESAGARIERAGDADAGERPGRVQAADHRLAFGIRRGRERQRHRAVCQPPAKEADANRGDHPRCARHRLLPAARRRSLMPSAAPYSLRRRLLFWLLVPLVLIGVVGLTETYRSARTLADQVSDRVLAGSAQAIGERVVVGDEGALEVDIPYVALDMLTSAAQDRVFYRIDGPPGSFVTGYQSLPEPDGGEDVRTGLSFHDAVFRGEPIRVAILNGAASTGLSSLPFRVTVAETTNARRRLSNDILLRSAARQALLIISAAIIVWFAVSRGLKPLYRLEQAIGRRSSDDLRPIEHRVPREVGGLVSTINKFMARLAVAIDALRHFTGNASHQFRNPLAIVRTELALSMRAKSLAEAQAAAESADRAVVHAERVLSQLLLLARVDEAASDAMAAETTDLAALARDVTADHVREATARGVDLGVEAEGTADVHGDAMLLGELLRNLLENVMRYAAGSGEATVRVERQGHSVVLEVEDCGPGIAPAMREQLCARFSRGGATSDGGAGLGLSIVAEIAALFGGTFVLADARSGTGLAARATFPAAT